MTAQTPEVLIMNGQEFMMISTPDLNGKATYGFCLSTGNYRGYVGVWEIKDSKLYLNQMKHGQMLEDGPIFADWVSQELIVWKGNMLAYIHAGFDSVFEEEMSLDIKQGILKNRMEKSNIERYKSNAFKEINEADSKQRLQYLYRCYLDPNGDLSRLIAKSTNRKQEYIDFQKSLEFDFKQRLIILSEDPNSGITLRYK
jgi:hypothetical protein